MASKRGPRAPRKVKAISFCLCDANILIADVEPEDLDLGNFDQEGLAFDVDENMDYPTPRRAHPADIWPIRYCR